MRSREYRLVVEGELSDLLSPAFAGMALTHQQGNTLLITRIRDQAELQGILQRVSSLGLTLLEVTTTDEHPGEAGGADAHRAGRSPLRPATSQKGEPWVPPQ